MALTSGILWFLIDCSLSYGIIDFSIEKESEKIFEKSEVTFAMRGIKFVSDPSLEVLTFSISLVSQPLVHQKW